ncbi:hypothetical protein JKP88DRAFT_165343 [Tribonema minus]|uniref:Pyrroline-5-carboxylate reductase n=1 Tax=Tribonema minus TaxID=303371 RepID=A0A836CE07_9STRA|nr:hypothetical protein JKP88DRAFT_165343 [Tribonema minus]
MDPRLRGARINIPPTVDNADVVFLCLLPDAARSVLPSTRFPEHARIISVMATITMAELKALLPDVNPSRIVRCIPLPSCARRLGPILQYPGTGGIYAAGDPLLQQIGTPVVCASEADMEPLIALTAMITPYHAFQQSLSEWAQEEGVEAPVAGAFVGALFSALGRLSEREFDPAFNTFADMADDAATRGGLNEQTGATLGRAGVWGQVKGACGAILQRLRGG